MTTIPMTFHAGAVRPPFGGGAATRSAADIRAKIGLSPPQSDNLHSHPTQHTHTPESPPQSDNLHSHPTQHTHTPESRPQSDNLHSHPTPHGFQKNAESSPKKDAPSNVFTTKTLNHDEDEPDHYAHRDDGDATELDSISTMTPVHSVLLSSSCAPSLTSSSRPSSAGSWSGAHGKGRSPGLTMEDLTAALEEINEEDESLLPSCSMWKLPPPPTHAPPPAPSPPGTHLLGGSPCVPKNDSQQPTDIGIVKGDTVVVPKMTARSHTTCPEKRGSHIKSPQQPQDREAKRIKAPPVARTSVGSMGEKSNKSSQKKAAPINHSTIKHDICENPSAPTMRPKMDLLRR